MQAGIDDEPHRAQHLHVEVAKPLPGIGEHAEFTAERFGVKAPAFGIGSVRAGAQQGRQCRIFLGQRDLEVVAGDAFMERQRFEGRDRPGVEHRHVEE